MILLMKIFALFTYSLFDLPRASVRDVCFDDPMMNMHSRSAESSDKKLLVARR